MLKFKWLNFYKANLNKKFKNGEELTTLEKMVDLSKENNT